MAREGVLGCVRRVGHPRSNAADGGLSTAETKKRRAFALRFLPILQFFFVEAELLCEPFQPSGRIHYLLHPGEEGVAFRANVNLQGLLRRAGYEAVAAGTGDRRLVELWVDFFLQRQILLKNNFISSNIRLIRNSSCRPAANFSHIIFAPDDKYFHY
jgi:hypothetical protein